MEKIFLWQFINKIKPKYDIRFKSLYHHLNNIKEFYGVRAIINDIF
jgi:hypothetical protein